MIREQAAGALQLRKSPRMRHDACRIVDIGRLGSDLPRHLREDRSAQALRPARQVDQHQHSFAESATSCGVSACRTSPTPAAALAISETGALTTRSASPSRQAVFIDNESLPTGTLIPSAWHISLAAPDRVEQARVLARFPARSHPVA